MSPVDVDTPAPAFLARFNVQSRGWWALVGGLSLIAILTITDLMRESWSHEFGAYGPIILGAGLWLLWRRSDAMRRDARPGSLAICLAILAPSLAAFIAGHAFDYPTLTSVGLWGAGMAVLYLKVGPRVMAREWFPLIYLLFVVPPPATLLSIITEPLKELVSSAATGGLAAFGIPVIHEGVIIDVAQYQLLVEDACSGLNSMLGLTAISLLYIYLMRGSSLLYAAFLTAFVIPIAILANIVRIMVLILLTYFAGNEVAQSYLHFMAGILLFSTAILLVFGLDTVAASTLARMRLKLRAG